MSSTRSITKQNKVSLNLFFLWRKKLPEKTNPKKNPTCQVRVVRFYFSCLPPSAPPAASVRACFRSCLPPRCDLRSPAVPAGPQPRPSPPSVPCLNHQHPAQCSLSDLNQDHPRPEFPAGPQPGQSPPSDPCRSSTTTVHAQWSLPNLNRDFQMSEKMSDRMWGRMPDRKPDRMSEEMPDKMSEHMPNEMSDVISDRMPEDMPDRMAYKMSKKYVRHCQFLLCGQWRKFHSCMSGAIGRRLRQATSYSKLLQITCCDLIFGYYLKDSHRIFVMLRWICDIGIYVGAFDPSSKAGWTSKLRRHWSGCSPGLSMMHCKHPDTVHWTFASLVWWKNIALQLQLCDDVTLASFCRVNTSFIRKSCQQAVLKCHGGDHSK